MSPLKIKSLRNRLHLSQKQFASLMHVSRETIARWESGRAKPLPAFAALMQQLQPENRKAVAKAQDMVPLKIQRLRQMMRLSQRQFAKRLNVERETVARWETGVQIPQPVCVAALNQLSILMTKQPCFSTAFHRPQRKVALRAIS